MPASSNPRRKAQRGDTIIMPFKRCGQLATLLGRRCQPRRWCATTGGASEHHATLPNAEFSLEPGDPVVVMIPAPAQPRLRSVLISIGNPGRITPGVSIEAQVDALNGRRRRFHHDQESPLAAIPTCSGRSASPGTPLPDHRHSAAEIERRRPARSNRWQSRSGSPNLAMMTRRRRRRLRDRAER